jgi:polar amino acid transport system substrate-binding protein
MKPYTVVCNAVCAAALAAGCASNALSPEAKSQLAPAGALRVAVLTSNPIIHRTTPALGRELATQAGVPVKLIDYGAVNKLMQDATNGAWDVAVVATDPERQAIVDFAPAHLAADGFLTVLVPPGSSARRMADIDQPGMRVAAVRGAATQIVLARTLKNASVLAAENEDAAFESMKAGKAQGYAQNRFILRARAATLPGSRLLDDSFAGLHLAVALPKKRPAAARYVTQFVEKAKADGTVQRAIEDAGLGGEVNVAPAAQELPYKGM